MLYIQLFDGFWRQIFAGRKTLQIDESEMVCTCLFGLNKILDVSQQIHAIDKSSRF